MSVQSQKMELVCKIGVLLNPGSLLFGGGVKNPFTDDEVNHLAELPPELLVKMLQFVQEKHQQAVSFINMTGR